MNVLMVSHYFETHRGGVEIVAGRMVRAFANRSDVHVNWVASNSTPPAKNENSGFICHPVAALNLTEKYLGIPFPIWGIESYRVLKKLIGDADVVVLQDSLYMGNVMAFVLARRRRKPIIIVQHIGIVPYRNPVLSGLMSLANRFVASPCLSKADQVVFISEITREYFVRTVRFSAPPQTVYNGVDVDTFRPPVGDERTRARDDLQLSDASNVFLFVGRFVEKKGLPVLKELAIRFPDVHWLMAGWGPVDPEAWKLPNVSVLRDRSGESLRALYHASDMLILPSVGEGFPLVIQEALSCGMPVLCGADTATADPSIQESLFSAPVDLQNISSTAASWQRAIEELMPTLPVDADESERLHLLAKERYSWSSATDIYMEIMQRVLGGTPSDTPGAT